MLSFSLEAVFCQKLLPQASGSGRCLAAEILLANPGVRALIRDGKTHQIYSQIQTGGRMGMTTMAQSLSHLVTAGRVRMADAEAVLSDPGELHNSLRAA
jgi:twitching motility protein PilT